MLGLALLTGVVAGVVIASGVGARRTATAYDRFLVENRAEDFLMGAPAVGSPEADRIVADLQAAAIVDEVAVATGIGLFPGELGPFTDAVAPVDDELLVDLDVPNLLVGRLPDPDRVDEILIDPATRDTYGVSVGDDLTLYGLTEADFYAHPGEAPRTYGEPRRFTVTGVGVFANQVVPLAVLDSAPQVVVTRAYADAHPEEWYSYGFIRVRLTPGATEAELDEVVAETLRELDIDYRFVPVVRGSARTAAVNRAIRPQAQALGAFSVLLGLAAIGVLGQLLARHLLNDTDDRRRLWALGMTRHQLMVIAIARSGAIVGTAVLVAAVVAIGVSGRFPIGPARLAEPDPGSEIHVGGLVAGALSLAVVFVAIAALAVRQSLRDLGRAPGRPWNLQARPTRTASALARTGVPVPWVIGTHLALDRSNVRSAGAGTIAAAALAVAAVVAAWTFGTNLQRLVEDQSLQGWQWDATVGSAFVGLEEAQLAEVFGDRSVVEAYSGANVGRLQVAAPGGQAEGETVAAVGIDQLVGDVYPRLVDGRPARDPDEIVLGASVARRLGLSVGDAVEAGVLGDVPSPRQITGLAVLPGLGAGIFATTDLGEGAIVPASELADGTTGGPYTLTLVDLVDGVDETAALQAIEADYGRLEGNCVPGLCVVTDLPPPGVRNAVRLRSTPTALAGLLAVLAVVTLGANLLTTVRRRRRDFAVLRALGFHRTQVAAACAGHAVVVGVVACLIGVPVGVVIGRQLWVAFAERVAAFVGAQTPIVAVVLALPMTIAVAVVIAVVPGWLASRADPVAVLRAE